VDGADSLTEVNSNVLILCCLGALLLLASACSRKVSEPNIIGAYSADYGFAKDKLELSADHTFHQEVKVIATNKAVSASGTWRFEEKHSEIYFSEEFLVIADGFGNLIRDFDKSTRKAIAVFPVRSKFGHVEIAGDPAVTYKKID
jgi:hypothetical protein